MLFPRPIFHKRWNLHIYILKKLSRLSGRNLCKSTKNIYIYIFSAGVSNVLFSILRSYENILLIEEVQEIRDIALAPYTSFNSP